MRRPTRRAERLAPALVVLGLLIGACDNRQAGTSSTVDNPAIAALTVTFRDSAGPLRLTGTVEVFAESQNPWTEASLYNTESGAERYVLDSLRLDSLFRALKASGTAAGGIPPGSTGFTFNILVRDRINRGGMLANLKYDSLTRLIKDSNGVLDSASVALAPLIDVCGFLDGDTTGKPFIVFTRGAPYTATVEAGSTLFVFHGLIRGSYSLRAVDASGAMFPMYEPLQAKPCPENPLAPGADVPHFTKGVISVGRIQLPGT